MNRHIPPSCETVYLGMYSEILNSSNLYILAFFVRRALYAIAMIMLTSRPAGQVFILLCMSTLMGGLLGNAKPYFFPNNQRL